MRLVASKFRPTDFPTDNPTDFLVIPQLHTETTIFASIKNRTQFNVRELGSLIYDTVFSLRSPGSKELLLHQNVPASYLALEDVVANISTYLKQIGSDPVLNYDNFKQMVNQEMHFQNFKAFR